MNELMNVRMIELLNEVLNKLNEEFDLVNDFSDEEVKYYIKVSDLIEEIELNKMKDINKMVYWGNDDFDE